MLTIRPESEPALRWAREVSDVLDDLAFQLYNQKMRARVSLENCLERLRTYGCETQSPFAPIDVDKCETVLRHERGVMFIWSCRNAGESSPWIGGGLCLSLPTSIRFIDSHPAQPVDVIRNQLLILQPTDLTFESLTWGTHT